MKKVSIPDTPDDAFIDAWTRFLAGGIKGSIPEHKAEHSRRSYQFIVEYYRSKKGA